MKRNYVILHKIHKNATEWNRERMDILISSSNPTVGCSWIIPHETNSDQNLSLPS